MTLGEDVSKQSVLWHSGDEVAGQPLCKNRRCFLSSYLQVRQHLPFILLNCPRHHFLNEGSPTPLISQVIYALGMMESAQANEGKALQGEDTAQQRL